MPRAVILTKQALFTLGTLHAELAGKIIQNKKEAKRLTVSMLQVEAVMKMLDPAYSVRAISVRRRKPNPWFKRGTMSRHALDALRGAEVPLTAREVAARMLDARGVTDATRKQVRELVGAVQSSLRNQEGKTVKSEGVGAPLRWRLT